MPEVGLSTPMPPDSTKSLPKVYQTGRTILRCSSTHNIEAYIMLPQDGSLFPFDQIRQRDCRHERHPSDDQRAIQDDEPSRRSNPHRSRFMPQSTPKTVGPTLPAPHHLPAPCQAPALPPTHWREEARDPQSANVTCTSTSGKTAKATLTVSPPK